MLYDFEAEGFKVQQSEKSQQQEVGDKEEESVPGFSLWNVGNLVTKGAKDLVQTVQQTDWKKEINSLTSGTQNQEEEGEKKGLQVKEKLDQLSLFGQTFLQGTKEIWNQVTETIDSDIKEATNEVKRGNRSTPTVVSKTKQVKTTKKANKFDAEVSSMQRQSSTYIEEPVDVDDFEKFKSNFKLSQKQQQIEDLLASNSFMSTLHQRLVPQIVDDYTFWSRYFYQLNLLHQKYAATNEEEEVQQPQQSQEKSFEDHDQYVTDIKIKQVIDKSSHDDASSEEDSQKGQKKEADSVEISTATVQKTQIEDVNKEASANTNEETSTINAEDADETDKSSEYLIV
eukprot:TRINITY_DN21212_c0_g1_i3.p1 TRINITY_DN21212_c0_g1~~TRINITY_DN21212_c0_g1_i3.p1  ORF type:complete len:341 (-),score=64.20 TRINITY_DN21212_c0_g1_i3:647-1669(-)